MPPVKTTAAGGKKLPAVTVARFEEALKLVDRIYEANVESSLTRLQDYRDRHRAATQRPLTAEEAVRWAAVARDILKEEPYTPADLQASGLYEYDQPGAKELLVAGGLATGTGLLDACRQFVALMELPATTFVEAYDTDMVQDAVEAAAAKFAHVELQEAKQRTSAALTHFAAFQDGAPGEVLRSLIETVTGALEQAAVRVSAEVSQQLSVTDSVGSTDGTVTMSSTV
jgi:hypothetical protein